MAMDPTDDWEWAMEGWAASCHHLEQVAARIDVIAFDFAQRDEDLHAELISARDYALTHAKDQDAECRPSCGAKDERGCDGYEHCGCRCHDGEEEPEHRHEWSSGGGSLGGGAWSCPCGATKPRIIGPGV